MRLSPLLVLLCLSLAGCIYNSEDRPPLQAASFSAPSATGPVFLGGADSVVTTNRRLLEQDVYGVGPDGRFFATTDWHTGDVVIRDVRGEDVRRLTHNSMPWAEGFGMFTPVSRDGKHVVYTWQTFTHPAQVSLRVADLSGEEVETQIIYEAPEGEWVYPYDWSPDGSAVVASHHLEDGSHGIILIPVAGEEPRVLTTLGYSSPVNMAFSPDGRWVAYDVAPRDESPARDVYVVSTDGRRTLAVVADDSNDYVLGWTSEGHVLFSSDRTGTPGVWRVAVDEGRAVGAPELVRPDIAHVWALGLDQKDRLYYIMNVGRRDVHLLSLDPDGQRLAAPPTRVVPRSTGGTGSPAWSPDGRLLAYLSHQPSHFQGVGAVQTVMVRSLESGDTREFRLPPRVHGVGSLTWHEDGRTLLAAARFDRGQRSVLRIDVQTGAIERVNSGQPSTPHLLPNGRDMVFTRFMDRAVGEPSRVEIMIRDLDSGEERLLHRVVSDGPNPVRVLVASKDGGLLALNVARMNGPHPLLVIDLQSGDVREVGAAPAILSFGSLAFSADNTALLFGGRHDDDLEGLPRLLRLPLDGSSEAVELAYIPEGVIFIRPHPDGRRIAFVSGEVTPELWVMENIAPVSRR